MAAAGVASSRWRAKKRRVFQSVFQTEITQPTPYSTPSLRFPEHGQPFGGPVLANNPHPGISTLSTAEPHGADPEDEMILRDASLSNWKALQSRHGTSLTPPSPFQTRGAADDQIQFDRAWHVVTSRISLPSSVAAEDSFGTLAPESQRQSQDGSSEADFQAALRLVLNVKTALPRATHTDDILSWHTQQVRRHFVQHVLPMVAACAVPSHEGVEDGESRYYEQHMGAVLSSTRTLEAALRLYFYGLSLIVRGVQEGKGEAGGGGRNADVPLSKAKLVAARFQRDVHALVGNSASPSLMRSIRIVLARLMSTILGIQGRQGTAKANLRAGEKRPRTAAFERPRPPVDDDTQVSEARRRLHDVISTLFNVGLAGQRFQILFAEIMDNMMAEFIMGAYARLWTPMDDQEKESGGLAKQSKSSRLASTHGLSLCITSLYDWIENHYARLALEVLSRISTGESLEVSFSDVKIWKEIGLGRLATLRISELFDIVLQWPASKGGLEDLRASVTTPKLRAQVITAFSAMLQKRLLHPARSTLEILQVYIAMIRTFHALDQSNVLLSGAVGPLQMYLCQRDDAVRIVVTGLLANPDEVKAAIADESKNPKIVDSGSIDKPTSGSGKLVELAVLLNDPAQQRRQYVDEEDLDWNDMDWMPDPVDAGVNYKRPKSEDVIGTIISALGSQDVFIKEFQNIIAERLLSAQPDFTQEVKVLNLLKKRFGEGALQNCDVMIKDIQDSRRVDNAIRRAQIHQQKGLTTPATPAGPSAQGYLHADQPASDTDLRYQTRILSRLFWPNIAKDEFRLPTAVAEAQKRYEAGYEHLKSSRKLTWLDHLGQATVELELEDRSVTVDCATYEAAVIYAFQDDNAPRLSVDDVVSALQMDDDLVRAALGFWTREGILRHLGDGLYAVIETRADAPEEGNAPLQTQSAPAVPDAPAQGKGLDAQEKMQRTVYWQFIVGMLTNSASSMPLGQIAMMMKMMIPDRFPWSNEELQEFLGEKVVEGALEVVGGKYRLGKK